MYFFRFIRCLIWVIISLCGVSLLAQDRVVINESIDAEIKRGVMPVTILCDDLSLASMVKFAVNAHGAFSVRNGSSLQVKIGRNGVTAAVACDNPRATFQTTVEAKDEDELALRVADAIIVGLGRTWQLKPLFADTKVAFVSRYTGHAEIYSSNLIFSRTRRLTNLASTSVAPRWSNEGSRIYFVTSARSGFPEIFSTNGSDKPRKVIVDVRGALGGASSGPDGRLVFASSNKNSMDIYVSGPSGESPRAVVSTPNVDADPSWSPDGSRIVLTSGPLGRPGIYITSSSGGVLNRVSTGYSYCTEPRWNPVESSLIAFTFQSGRLGLAVADIKSGTITPVPVTSPLNLSHSSWCADGRHLVATQATNNRSWIALVDTVTGKVTRISDAKLGDCSEPDCWVRVNRN